VDKNYEDNLNNNQNRTPSTLSKRNVVESVSTETKINSGTQSPTNSYKLFLNNTNNKNNFNNMNQSSLSGPSSQQRYVPSRQIVTNSNNNQQLPQYDQYSSPLSQRTGNNLSNRVSEKRRRRN
jgi:hypothetical protein